jgi:hypothetical protein
MMMGPEAVCRQRDLLMETDDRLQRLERSDHREITNLLKLLLSECVLGLMAKGKEADDE